MPKHMKQNRMQFYVCRNSSYFSDNIRIFPVEYPPIWEDAGIFGQTLKDGGGYWKSRAGLQEMEIMYKLSLHMFGFIPKCGECWWCVLSEDQQSWEYELISIGGR